MWLRRRGEERQKKKKKKSLPRCQTNAVLYSPTRTRASFAPASEEKSWGFFFWRPSEHMKHIVRGLYSASQMQWSEINSVTQGIIAGVVADVFFFFLCRGPRSQLLPAQKIQTRGAECCSSRKRKQVCFYVKIENTQGLTQKWNTSTVKRPILLKCKFLRKSCLMLLGSDGVVTSTLPSKQDELVSLLNTVIESYFACCCIMLMYIKALFTPGFKWKRENAPCVLGAGFHSSDTWSLLKCNLAKPLPRLGGKSRWDAHVDWQ